MQFKHPEILWALLLLLIPILIHLFQLRRYKKTPFTNVSLLKKVVSESRKSSSIKKWLILSSRLGIFTGIILAFAQPYSANVNALKNMENIFYLDNSFSMQAKTENGTLLQNTVQEFVQNIPENELFTLFTNDDFYKEVYIKDIQNELLTLKHSDKQLSLEQIRLKANSLFKKNNESLKKLVVISDFQQRMGSISIDSSDITTQLIQVSVPDFINISIDSVYLNETDTENLELVAILSSNKDLESTPVSLYDKENLIAKTSANFNKRKKASVPFTLPKNETINGRIIASDKGLSYDNQFYFNLNEPKKIQVLSVGSEDDKFLEKIFQSEEFSFSNTSLAQFNYGALEKYNIIVLNGLESISTGLATALTSFKNEGGSLVVIPSSDIDVSSYNYFLQSFFSTKISEKSNNKVAISNIKFEHPLFKNVFEKSVTNFQFPQVSTYYRISSLAPTALALQNNEPFLLGADNFYFFTASLSLDNSTFKNSPLIVPVLYNMAVGSLKQTEIYNILGNETSIDIPISLSKDDILKVSNSEMEFIPEQQSMTKKVRLTFNENPAVDGIFQIKSDEKIIKDISFNYNRSESYLTYLKLDETKQPFKTVIDYFEDILKANSINEFWKWFAILALTFVIIETLLHRLLK